MATIREELVIGGNFASVFSSYVNLGKQMAASMRVVTETQNDFTAAAAQSSAALEEMAGIGSRAADSVEEIGTAAQKMAGSSDHAANRQDRLNRSMRSGSSAADGLTRKIMGLAAAYLSLQSAKKLIDLSDAWTQTTARLDMVNEKYGTDTDLSGMIHQSALRSGSSYLDTADAVSKMALNAGTAFSAPEEVVAFMEQINKQFQISGASTAEQKNAMIQLTQAMAAGTLRGEELNSILDQAPGIARAIESYMGIAEGSIKSYAEQGLITAQVVKNAMFDTAAETEKRYSQIPMTWSRAWETAKTEAIFAIEPVLEELNAFLNSDIGKDALNGFISAIRMGGELLLWLVEKAEDAATYIHDNWDTVSDALIVGAAAVAAVMAASAISTAVSWAIANWQMLLVVATIAMVIYMAREMGYTWEEIGGVIGGLLGAWATALYNNVSYSQNLIAAFAEFFANVFDNPVAAVANLFADLFDLIMRTVQNAASAIDMLLGTNISAGIANLRSTVQGFVEKTFGENEIKVKRMDMREYKYGWENGMEKGRAVGSFLDNFHAEDFLSKAGERFAPDYDGLIDKMGGAYDDLAGKLGGIGEDTKAIRSSVSLSEEDIKLLVDMATREYVNNINLTAQTPIINVSGQNTGDTELDKQYLADALRDILIEQAASHTDLAYT